MRGLDAQAGTTLEGEAHLAQSIRDILTTPLGSRVMRRDYGSTLPGLIDAPINPQTFALIYAGAAEALARWEPRIEVVRFEIPATEAGRIELVVDAREGDRQFQTGVVLGNAA
ncbi:MAG: GPW/gp25 family protein [Pseudomonadota bacterium]